MMTRSSVAMFVSATLVMTACGTSQPVTAEQFAQEERRLLTPFSAGGEVGCGELVIETTGNFAQDNIGRPSTDVVRHGRPQIRIDEGNYTETVWSNRTGTVEGALRVTIGEAGEVGAFVPGRYTTFTVLNSVRLRVLSGRHPMTLNVQATGAPLVVLEAGASRDLVHYSVADGVLTKN